MKKLNYLLFLTCLSIIACKTEPKAQLADTADKGNTELVAEDPSENKRLEINPISHATMVLQYGDAIIYVDPTGGADAFKEFSTPDIVLITDIHGDHMDIETLKDIDLSLTTIIGPKAVIDQLPKDLAKIMVTLNNGDSYEPKNVSIEAVPMYNLREEALKFHEKGRGNGYVLTIGGERIYISGDTEDIPEMRSLEAIDKAFVCMNLPYTMTVEKAADAVLAFEPKEVYPYHYRGTDGLSDTTKFKTLVNEGNADIEVIQLNWYQ
ncbi:L-ascorbate metabolism protein UlaG, beta-lactamase superfamily [Formosa sp. Hel1_31_208]|uniref:MBL fold metallo-hydrolase n=1 Tax=Formosa sp. Hel1_31_208 TaxID=1798225 RepID=UPI00087B3075|nr:MBL fold metallo-hydrolase [Formosa sp. Hel1_31_208]SDS47157.1 L-ascorbate metabolism protein UlaG, beta-lactamase superfamily [Formosa sp. Hel1_31_208]